MLAHIICLRLMWKRLLWFDRSCRWLISLLHAACKNHVSASGLHGRLAKDKWSSTSSKLVGF